MPLPSIRAQTSACTALTAEARDTGLVWWLMRRHDAGSNARTFEREANTTASKRNLHVAITYTMLLVQRVQHIGSPKRPGAPLHSDAETVTAHSALRLRLHRQSLETPSATAHAQKIACTAGKHRERFHRLVVTGRRMASREWDQRTHTRSACARLPACTATAQHAKLLVRSQVMIAQPATSQASRMICARRQRNGARSRRRRGSEVLLSSRIL